MKAGTELADEGRNPAVVVTRGAGIDAVHHAAVAVVDSDGRLTHRHGDPELVVFTRSSIKPFQALALLRSGAAEQLDLDAEELAIACGSHNGTDRHVAVVRRLLARSGATPAELGCGTQWPSGMRLSGQYPLAGENRDPLRHNCSGKHAGFLACAHVLGEPFARYLEPESLVQRLVRDCVAEACGLAPDSLLAGSDGCSAPNYALPLASLARAGKDLALAGLPGERGALGLAPLRAAMQAHPLLVSGEGRFDAELASAFPGNVVAKGGAEGLLMLGFAEPALGIAIKVLDGAERALAPVVVAVLQRLGLLAARDERLAARARPLVRNARGIVTGEIVAQLELERESNG
jgi:L-asparaginase II